MAQLLVRDITEDLVVALKEKAKHHHRSLQGEVKAILIDSARIPLASEQAKRLRALQIELFGKKRFADSTPMIRKDRER